MDLSQHAAISLPASAAVWMLTGDAAAAAAFGFGAVLIDLDHLLDYWRETGLNADWRRFLGYFDGREPQRLLLAWHGWEWPLLILALWAVAALPLWVAALAAGMLCHLGMDQRYNGLLPLTYFFSYRWSRDFKAGSLYKD